MYGPGGIWAPGRGLSRVKRTNTQFDDEEDEVV
jgi:hypothetical protein